MQSNLMKLLFMDLSLISWVAQAVTLSRNITAQLLNSNVINPVRRINMNDTTMLMAHIPVGDAYIHVTHVLIQLYVLLVFIIWT